MSPADAAKAYGIRPRTLRERAQKGLIPRMEDARGSYLYAVPSGVHDDNTAPDQEATESPPPVLDPEFEDTAPLRGTPSAEGETHSIAALFDVHVPNHDPRAWEIALRIIEDEQPDEVILVGDFLDMESMTGHTRTGPPEHTFQSELAAGRRELGRLREAAGDAAITYLEGNHESRPGRLAMQRMSQVFDLVGLDNLLGLRELGIAWRPEGSHIRRGLDNGITPEELSELVAQLALYSGFPSGVNTSLTLAEVFRERGIPLP